MRLNLSVIEETSENTYNGQSLMNGNGLSRNDAGLGNGELGEIKTGINV